VTEIGIVKRIDGSHVQVSFRDECGSCEKCGSCLSTSKPREFTVTNPKGLPLTVGDRIEFSVSPGKAVRSAFLLLILPVLLFFPFYYGAAALFPGRGEPAAVAVGLAGVAVAFGVNLLLRRGHREYPEIQRVVEPGNGPGNGLEGRAASPG
jgi:positive regulator of sigma E activity